MSQDRADDDAFSDSISAQSNDDADSDDSSWNEVHEAKKKSRSIPRPKSKSHRPGKKKSKRKSYKREAIIETNNSDADTASGIKCKPSKNKTQEKQCMQTEYFSDEVTSVMSDINPPSFATRSRRRKQEVRQARRVASSASSTFESEGKKAKSEPILITLDSESEDDVSMISIQPNRASRVRGEILRKLDRMAGVRKPSKCSSSSSDSEKVRKRKKSKIKSKASSSDKIKHSTIKKLQKHSTLKQHKKRLKTHIYKPIHRRLKVRNIRKRFKRQNIERRTTPIRQSRISASQIQSVENKVVGGTKRTLRKSSIVKINYQEEEEETTEMKLDRRKKRSYSDAKSNREENESNANLISGDDNPEENENIINDQNSDQMEKYVESMEHIDDNGKISEQIKSINKISEQIENDGKSSDEAANISSKDIDTKEKFDVKKLERSSGDSHDSKDEEDLNLKLEKQDEIDDNLPELSLKTVPEEVSNSENGLGNIKVVKSVGRKKKIKPPANIIRRKGRPRKIDANIDPKPVTETFNILSVKPQVPFLQNSFCFDVAPKLAKCRECRMAVYRSSKRMYNSYCRFMEYRKLCYNKNGMISSAGFSNPSDATTEHLNLWLPQPCEPPRDLNMETAKSLLEHIGDQFCDLVHQEKEALTLHIGLQQVITWKRVVQGVREMCDVCSTTIFNIHWVCPVCGLAVCIDCYKVRKHGVVIEDEEEHPKDRDEFKWLLCTLRQPHQQDCLVMAQIIPGTVLFLMKDWLHKAREKWNIPSYCKCNPQQMSAPDQLLSTGINKQLMSCVTKLFLSEKGQSLASEKQICNPDNNYDELDIEVTGSALRWLDNSTMNTDNANNLRGSDDYFNSFEDFALLRGTGLIHDSHENTSESDNEMSNFTLDDIIASVTNLHGIHSKDGSERYRVKHFSQRYPQPKSGRDPLPIRIYTKIESEIAFSTVPHSWFCNGRLLFLHQATHKDNLALFQEQWKRGQPILVKSVDQNLDMNLWHPDGFCRDFGEVKNDLVDCKTGNILRNLPMRKFWEGFENFSKRLTDDNGEFMLLKLKDWPPGEDFSEKLPTRFDDLMQGLPLPEYTHRNGILNLAGRLPSSFVRPDLGPKMYNAYGSALYPAKGTTNLHLDVSDAVNVMVYVGIPTDGIAQIHVQEALKAIDEGGCDSLMRARVRQRGCKPGALWHIYNARDADKIREMLTKVAIERGEKLEAHHDPIHDQSWYIDAELRLRLYRDYGVEGYAIAQCLGDAVFIPAGAPHQVRNLHSCVKVAEDFVSPENIAHCFKLTQEFRNLSDTHTNHEDKLQIKNIIYHVVKDSLSHLLSEGETQR